jgi:hypothetical protein
VATVYDRPCRQPCNYKIHHHTDRSYSPDDKIRFRYSLGLVPPGSKVDSGNFLAAFDTLCIGFGPYTPPSTHSDTGKRYILSARRETLKSIRSALDSKRWRSYCPAIWSLADGMIWDITLSACARTWYWIEHVISNMGDRFSIPLSISPLFLPQILWTKCCFAA